MPNETPNRVHASGLFVGTDPVAQPFTSAIVNSKGVFSFARLDVGQYLLALQRPLAFHEGYADAGLPANFQATSGAQISEDGLTVLVSVLALSTGIPVDPPIFSCTVWAVVEGEGQGPAIPFPAIPPPIPGGGGELRQSFTNANLVAGVLTVAHNLGSQYNSVTIYDDLNQITLPDFVTGVDANTLAIDLSSFGVIAGGWNVVVGG